MSGYKVTFSDDKKTVFIELLGGASLRDITSLIGHYGHLGFDTVSTDCGGFKIERTEEVEEDWY